MQCSKCFQYAGISDPLVMIVDGNAVIYVCLKCLKKMLAEVDAQ